MVVHQLILKRSCFCKKFEKIFLTFHMFLQCCPVLNPHITGLPLFPGTPITNESLVQSPIAPPPPVGGVPESVAVAVTGVLILNT